jgi:membrane protein
MTASETRAPDRPTDLSKQSWMGTLKRTFREFKEDDLTLLAAALTYYGILSLFPALLVLLALLGLAGTDTIDTLLNNLGSLTPTATRDVITNAVRDLQSANSSAGIALIAGLAGALWSASGYVGGYMKAANVIYEVEEGRKFWKLKPLQIFTTLVIMILTTIIVLAVVVSGPVAQRVGNIIGAGDTAVTVFNIVKWPIIALVVSQIFAFLYYVGPNVKQPGFRWISPGGIVAVVLWVIASAAFAFYVSKFGSYSKTYGSMAAVIIFLVWLWITNVVMLLGAEFNAEVERGRQIEAGHPPDEEPFLPVREAPKTS